MGTIAIKNKFCSIQIFFWRRHLLWRHRIADDQPKVNLFFLKPLESCGILTTIHSSLAKHVLLLFAAKLILIFQSFSLSTQKVLKI